MDPIPLEFLSNIISIILVGILVFNYLKHKRNIEIIQKLDLLKTNNELTEQDIIYINEKEKEYKEKGENAEALIKFLNPLFILIVGILFIYFPFAEAMIHLNTIVVLFILVQLNKINKKNTYTLLKELKKEDE
jgi:hypothetical protein